jgi:hypothetical protein
MSTTTEYLQELIADTAALEKQVSQLRRRLQTADNNLSFLGSEISSTLQEIMGENGIKRLDLESLGTEEMNLITKCLSFERVLIRYLVADTTAPSLIYIDTEGESGFVENLPPQTLIRISKKLIDYLKRNGNR